MKGTKRLLSWLLIVCTVFGMLPAVALTSSAATGTYKKVTTTPADWTGTYLVVCETESVALNGALTAFDVTSNNVAVTINSDSIEATDALAAATVSFVKSGDKYLVKTASGKYIGRKTASNGVDTFSSEAEADLHELSVTDGVASIKASSGRILLFNNNATQMRFRYYEKTSSVVKNIALYKLETGSEGGEEPGGDEPDEPTDGTIETGNYVIAVNINGTYYAMSNDFDTMTNGTATKLNPTEITVTNGKVSVDVANEHFVKITKDGDGYTVQSGSKYLGYPGTGTNFNIYDAPYYWNIGEGTNGTYRVTSVQTPARGILYYVSAPNKFGGYNATNAGPTSTSYYDVEILPIEGTVVEQKEIQPGNYVIAAKVGDTYYGMLNDYSGHIDGKDITSLIAEDGTVDINNVKNFYVEIGKGVNGYSVYNGEHYLGFTASGPTSFGALDTPVYWTAKDGVNGTYRFAYATNTAKALAFGYATNTGDEFAAYDASDITADSATYYDIELIPAVGEIIEIPEITIADGTYVIAAKVGDVYYALSSAFPTAATTVTGSEITVVDGKVPGEFAEGFAVDLKKTAGGYTISWDGQYLVHGNDTSGLKGDEAAYTWELIVGTNGSVRALAPETKTAVNPRSLSYTARTNRFGCYVAANASAGSTNYFDIELLPIEGEIGGGEVEIEEGFYVIAANVDGTFYGLPSAFADGGKATGSVVNVTDGMVDATDAKGFVVYIEKTSNGYSIFNGASYLSYPGSGTNMNTSSAAYEWTASKGKDDACHIASYLVTNRALNYRTGDYNVFGIYDDSNLTKDEYFDVFLLPINGNVDFDDNGGGEGGGDDDDVPTEGNVYVTMKIITGEGEVYLMKLGETGVYGNAATEKGVPKTNWTNSGEDMVLVIKPAEGYRVACIERQVNRLVPGNGTDSGTNAGYKYDANINGYVYTFKASEVSAENYFRISFLPRQSEGGYNATQITGWIGDMTGEYVITGLEEPQTYLDNKHNGSTTYLLYGDSDTAKDDGYEAIGRKSSALQLTSVGVVLNATDPYLMTGLNETHLMRFEKVGDYYVIRLFGAKDANYYICAKESSADIYTVNTYENNNYALWDISYLSNGAVAIKNVGWSEAGKERFLMFNNASHNLQFRCYESDLSEAAYPILYRASNISHLVSYSVVNGQGGNVSGTNLSTDATLGASAYQPKDSDLSFTAKPNPGWKIDSIQITHIVNGVEQTYSVTVTDPESDFTFTYDNLNSDISVVVSFSQIGAVSFYVEYYINDVKAVTASINAITPYTLQTSGTVTGTDGKTYDLTKLTVSENTYNLSNLSFDGCLLGTDVYADLNARINVKTGNTIKANFSTTKVSRVKTVEEITQMGASNAANGGEKIDDDTYLFTDGNTKDEHGNVEQSYRVTLQVTSNEMIEESEKGGNTDIILILDHSNSMYPGFTGGSNNITYLTAAVNAFTDEIFKNNNEGDNRIAVVQYDSWARAWNGSSAVKMTNYVTTNSTYGLKYANCYMDTKAEVMAAFNELMVTPPTTDSQLKHGRTNTMGGLRFASIMASIRPTSTKRDMLVVMFTDGVPTCRYGTSGKVHTDTDLPYDDSDGEETSAFELMRAIIDGKELRKTVDSYKNCKSTIVNVALLNNTSFDKSNELVSDFIMSDKDVYQWSYDTSYSNIKHTDLTGDSSTASAEYIKDATFESQKSTLLKYFTRENPWADKYMKLTGNVTADQLKELYSNIAYEYVAAKYVKGTITDVIPADFTLTAESKAALEKAGCTVTPNSDGTTTIVTSEITADKVGATFTYDIVYNGSGYGSVHTNDKAIFTYKTLHEDATTTSYFPMPTATVVPWTVNDQSTAEPGIPKTIDILKNDLFEELREGGYILSDFTVTLTDAYGNPVSYADAIEQVGCGFDAVVDPTSGTVTYYTEKGGVSTFYYVVSATASAPDGTKTVVSSRATRVDVLVSELDKSAQEVTDRAELIPAKDHEGKDVPKTDAYGNKYQFYLITLNATMFNVANGTLTDKIPEYFQFVDFVQTIDGATTTFNKATNTITCTNIACGSQAKDMILSYYIRYIGENDIVGTGVVPTNVEAKITYTDVTDPNNPETLTREFPVPTAGVNPFTTNDVDLTEAGVPGTIDVKDNDMFTEIGTKVDDYVVTDVSIYITDENGNKLTQEQIDELGIDLTINEDGTISYNSPNGGTTQFYYIIESKVTLPGDDTYADGNSTTLVSRPTLVTIYASEDIVIVVDFGLKTEEIAFNDFVDVKIDGEKKLSTILHATAVAKVNASDPTYGEVKAENGKIFFTPSTTKFDGRAAYVSNLTLDKCEYTKQAKNLDATYTVIPANNLYYEESFLTLPEGSAWQEIQGETDPEKTFVAEQSASDSHNYELHGYDEAYNLLDQYSGRTQMGVTVSTANKEQNAYFTFSGTGFDIIGSTNSNSGVLVAELYEYDATKTNGLGAKLKNILVDTYLKGDVSYDQIPVVSYHHTDANGKPIYGTYRVKLRAFYNAIFDHNYPVSRGVVTAAKIREALGWAADEDFEIQTIKAGAAAGKATRATGTLEAATQGQYNVYVDALRIYNPLGNNNVAVETPDVKVPTTVEELVSGKYVIATKFGEDYYAMGNNFSTAFTTVNGTLLTGYTGGAIHLSDAADYVVNVNRISNGVYTIKSDAGFLVYNGSGTGVKGIATADTVWNVSVGNEGGFRAIPSNDDPSRTRTLSSWLSSGTVKFGAYAVSNLANASYSEIVFIPVYNPVIVAPQAESVEGKLYTAAGEMDPDFNGINDTLLDADDFDQAQTKLISGAVYVAGEGNVTENDVQEYDGVYLSSSGKLKVSVSGNKGYLVRADGTNVQLALPFGKTLYPANVNDTMVWTVAGNVADGFTLTNGGKSLDISADGSLVLGTANTAWNAEAAGTRDYFKTYYLRDEDSGKYVRWTTEENAIAETADSTFAVQFYVKQNNGNFVLSDSFGNEDQVIVVCASNCALTNGLKGVECKPSNGTAKKDVYIDVVYDADGNLITNSNEVKYYYDANTKVELTARQIGDLCLTYYDDKYESVGPENEIYLRNTNGIAIKLANVADADTIRVSAKVPTGKGIAKLEVYNAFNEEWDTVSVITSRTEMYYDIDPIVLGNGNLLILRSNITDNADTAEDDTTTTSLALCHVKFASGNNISATSIVPMNTEDVSKVVRIIRNCYVDSVYIPVEEPELTDDINFGMSITAGAAIAASFTINVNKIEEYEDFRLEVEKVSANGVINKCVYSLEDGDMALKTIYNPTNGQPVLYVADWTSIVAKEMGDTFRATLYATKADGAPYCSQTKEASIKDYLMARISQAKASDELKTMAVDMLRYGAAAQVYFDYGTDNLVTADLTAAQLAYATKELPVAVDSSKVEGEGVNLKTSVTVDDKVRLNLTAIYESAGMAYIKVCDAESGEEIDKIDAPFSAMMTRATYANVEAKNMRKPMTFTLMDGENAVSKTITWNVESFVAQIRADEKSSAERIDLVNAMLTYGDSVAAYLAVN